MTTAWSNKRIVPPIFPHISAAVDLWLVWYIRDAELTWQPMPPQQPAGQFLHREWHHPPGGCTGLRMARQGQGQPANWNTDIKCHCSRFPTTNSEVSKNIVRPLAATLRKKVFFIKATLAKIKLFMGNFSKEGANVHPCNSFGGQFSSDAFFS